MTDIFFYVHSACQVSLGKLDQSCIGCIDHVIFHASFSCLSKASQAAKRDVA